LHLLFRKNKGLLPAVLLSLGVVLSSCAGEKSQHVTKEFAVPGEYTFAVPYSEAWKGTVLAISEEERISTLEKESGLIVTEYRNINKLVQLLLPAPMIGKVYKNGYTVQLHEVASGQTRIGVKSKLFLEQFSFHNSELHEDSIEAYMRQELFRKICIHLKPDARQCLALFPDYHMVSASCPAAPPASKAGITGQAAPPQVTAPKPKVMPVKTVQQALVKAGYEPGPVDGRMGQKTRAAILHFQQDKGIDETGTVDWVTMQALGF